MATDDDSQSKRSGKGVARRTNTARIRRRQFNLAEALDLLQFCRRKAGPAARKATSSPPSRPIMQPPLAERQKQPSAKQHGDAQQTKPKPLLLRASHLQLLHDKGLLPYLLRQVSSRSLSISMIVIQGPVPLALWLPLMQAHHLPIAPADVVVTPDELQQLQRNGTLASILTSLTSRRTLSRIRSFTVRAAEHGHAIVPIRIIKQLYSHFHAHSVIQFHGLSIGWDDQRTSGVAAAIIRWVLSHSRAGSQPSRFMQLHIIGSGTVADCRLFDGISHSHLGALPVHFDHCRLSDLKLDLKELAQVRFYQCQLDNLSLSNRYGLRGIRPLFHAQSSLHILACDDAVPLNELCDASSRMSRPSAVYVSDPIERMVEELFTRDGALRAHRSGQIDPHNADHAMLHHSTATQRRHEQSRVSDVIHSLLRRMVRQKAGKDTASERHDARPRPSDIRITRHDLDSSPANENRKNTQRDKKKSVVTSRNREKQRIYH